MELKPFISLHSEKYNQEIINAVISRTSNNFDDPVVFLNFDLLEGDLLNSHILSVGTNGKFYLYHSPVETYIQSLNRYWYIKGVFDQREFYNLYYRGTKL